MTPLPKASAEQTMRTFSLQRYFHTHLRISLHSIPHPPVETKIILYGRIRHLK